MKIYFTTLEYILQYLYLFIACKDKRFFPYHQIISRFSRIDQTTSIFFLSSSSYDPPNQTRWTSAFSLIKDKSFTEFGTEAQGRSIGGRTDLKHRKIPFSQH